MHSTAHWVTMDRRDSGRQVLVESVRARSRPPSAAASAAFGDVHGRKRISSGMPLSLSMVHVVSGDVTVCGSKSARDGIFLSARVEVIEVIDEACRVTATGILIRGFEKHIRAQQGK